MLKESLKPLAPFRDKTLILHGLCDKVRGDGDSHMRGMGCLLTGIELFPGNIQGGSHTPAGWASGLSIDQEIKNYLQRDQATRTRFGSLEFGVMVPDRADTWTRMVYTGPNRPITPIDNPYQMFNKLYGRLRDQQSLRSILDDLEGDLGRVARARSPGVVTGRPARRAYRFRPRDGARTAHRGAGRQSSGTSARTRCPQRERQHAAHHAHADRSHGQQLRRRFHARGHFADHQFGRQRPHEMAQHQRRPSRVVAQGRHGPRSARSTDTHQQMVLRATGVSDQAPGGNARTRRHGQLARQHAHRVDQRIGARATRTRSTTSRLCWWEAASISAWGDRSSIRRCRTIGCLWPWPAVSGIT